MSHNFVSQSLVGEHGARQYTKEAEEFLEDLAKSLEVPNEIFRRIEFQYQLMANWLERPHSRLAQFEPETYTQGSFQLGTIINPISEEDDYDIDLVCEVNIDKVDITQEKLKKLFGQELKDFTLSQNLAEPNSKKRCWELDHAPQYPFHMDILPAIPDGTSRQSKYLSEGIRNEWLEYGVSITDEEHENYRICSPEWPHSNPKGYAEWFRSCMRTVFDQKRKAMALQERVAAAEDIPVYRVKTPLQSAIQILKRHRDMTHDGDPDDKPISIIITTLAARAYGQDTTIAGALYGILSRMEDHIEDRGCVPWIENPTDPKENFADKWPDPKYPHRKDAFYEWLEKAKEDFASVAEAVDKRMIGEALASSMGNHVINEALNRKSSGAFGKIWNITKPRHKKEPPWGVNNIGEVKIVEAEYFRNGFRWHSFSGDSRALSKNCKLKFKAETNVTGDFDVYWQVVNTGYEAARADGLRGGFDITKTRGGSLVKEESTLYKGSHTIECFIVKHGLCVARSGEFIVNIR
tara:strand:+ start:9997 stop:11559 length:1563 start_codon:yes stop_codon:yes gene_type:complete